MCIGGFGWTLENFIEIGTCLGFDTCTEEFESLMICQVLCLCSLLEYPQRNLHIIFSSVSKLIFKVQLFLESYKDHRQDCTYLCNTEQHRSLSLI